MCASVFNEFQDLTRSHPRLTSLKVELWCVRVGGINIGDLNICIRSRAEPARSLDCDFEQHQTEKVESERDKT